MTFARPRAAKETLAVAKPLAGDRGMEFGSPPSFFRLKAAVIQGAGQ